MADVFQLINSTLSNTITTISGEQVLLNIASYINNNMIPFMFMYILPPTIILSWVNNTIVIIMFWFNKQVIQRITKSVRLYYIAIAITDISDSTSLHLRYFLGTFTDL